MDKYIYHTQDNGTLLDTKTTYLDQIFVPYDDGGINRFAMKIIKVIPTFMSELMIKHYTFKAVIVESKGEWPSIFSHFPKNVGDTIVLQEAFIRPYFLKQNNSYNYDKIEKIDAIDKIEEIEEILVVDI